MNDKTTMHNTSQNPSKKDSVSFLIEDSSLKTDIALM